MITVSFSADAERDLLEIKAYLAAVAVASVAEAYVLRLYRYCMSLSIFPQRGVKRDIDLRPQSSAHRNEKARPLSRAGPSR